MLIAAMAALMAALLLSFTASAQSTKAEEGVSYMNDRIASEPWSVHVVKVALADPTLEVRSTLARGTVLGLSTLRDQAMSIPAEAGTPLAGVNGDFYDRDGNYAGNPRGLQIVEGDLVSTPTGQPNYCAFWIDAQGVPHAADVKPEFQATLPGGRSFSFGVNEERSGNRAILYTPTLGRSTRTTAGGREFVLEKADKSSWVPFRIGEKHTARIREVTEAGNTRLEKNTLVLSFPSRMAGELPALEPGSEITLATATSPDLRGARTAIGGGSIITRGGKVAPLEKPENLRSANNYSLRSMFERHPRAAVGWSKTHIYLVEVDGRQQRLSVGMTLEELGAYMAKLGCEEAINLDGGGSATCWYRGRVVNSPCDGSERNIANGLVVLRRVKSAAN